MPFLKDISDETLMRRALELASQAIGLTSPNPMVGAVIVKGRKLIAEGFHRRAGTDHGEIVALKKAGSRARGATLVLNLEPCHHFGRTPPCVDAVVKSGIREVVIGMKDPNPKTNGKSIAKLKKAGVRVRVGVLREECEKLNEVFIKYIKTGMPFVTAKSAQTIDGKIATADRKSQWITAEETRQWARRKRVEFDAIMVGVNTVLRDNPTLNAVGTSKRLKKIIVDTSLRVSLKSQVFAGMRSGECIVVTTDKASSRDVHLFEHHGVRVMMCPTKAGRIDLTAMFKELGSLGISSVLIEGGSELISGALREKLVDKMHIYIAPKIMGDNRALGSVTGFNVRNLEQMIRLEDWEITPLKKDIFISGYVHRNH